MSHPEMTHDQRRAMWDVLMAVRAERARQHAKWGEQNHLDGTGEAWSASHGFVAGWHLEQRKRAIDWTDAAAERGEVTYALIAEEEIAEAMAESDPDRLRAELVQVAAVAVAWVEKIDRERGRS